MENLVCYEYVDSKQVHIEHILLRVDGNLKATRIQPVTIAMNGDTGRECYTLQQARSADAVFTVRIVKGTHHCRFTWRTSDPVKKTSILVYIGKIHDTRNCRRYWHEAKTLGFPADN